MIWSGTSNCSWTSVVASSGDRPPTAIPEIVTPGGISEGGGAVVVPPVVVVTVVPVVSSAAALTPPARTTAANAPAAAQASATDGKAEETFHAWSVAR